MTKTEEAEEIGKMLEERKQAGSAEIAGESGNEESSHVRTFPKPESWDNTGFRARISAILSTAEYGDVDISRIMLPDDPDVKAKFQFRRFRRQDAIIGDTFAEVEMHTLVQSILERGVLKDIYLQKVFDETTKEYLYHILDGHSRFRAWLTARESDPEIPEPNFKILDISDADAAQIAVELNRFAENLDAEDREALVVRLYEEAGIKQVDIAAQLGISKSYVSGIISAFVDVPEEARRLIEQRVWTVMHGRQLARLKDKGEYNAAQVQKSVETALARLRYEEKALEALRENPPETAKEDQAIGEITVSELEGIHASTMKEVRDGRKISYHGADKDVIKVGDTQVEPSISQTTRVLKSLGYTIVKESEETDEPPAEEVELELKIPAMPSKEILMDDPTGVYRCPICNGPTHPDVADRLGFEYLLGWSSQRGERAATHLLCEIKQRIETMRKRLSREEDMLAKNPLTRTLEEQNITLEEFNNKAHAVYKEALEERKAQWHRENVWPVLLSRLRKEQPDLVPDKYYAAYGRYLKKESGFVTHRDVAEALKLKSKGPVSQYFKKLEKAIEALE
ncbi:MAG: ParB/RepB/Spo0J family partition protein, partial [Candidatus Thorarchaeota archaeon]